jgi:periplasmic protein TonB
MAPALGVSALSHGAVLAAVLLTIATHDARQESAPDADLPPASSIVWMPASGDRGGGGGGGNETPEPPRRLQRAGRDSVSMPRLMRTSIELADAAASEPLIDAPVLPLASSEVTLPGVLESAAFATISLGPGSNDGAGSGPDNGIGPGSGPGLGDGQGGNTGGGPNRRGAKLVLPVLLREVKPQ